MLVKFKQAVHLKGKTVKGKDYSRGVHEVCEEHLADPHFHKLVKAGLVEDGEAAKVVAPASLQERQKMLAEKLASKPKAPQAPVDPSPGPTTVPPSDDADPEKDPVLSPEGGESESDEAPPAKSEEDLELERLMAEDEKAKQAEAEKAAKQKSKQKKG